MRIQLNGKNVNVTDGMRNHLEKKLSYFSKFLKEDDVVVASVSTRKNVQKLEVYFKYDGKDVKVKTEGHDFYAIVNQAMDVLKNKVGKIHSLKVKKSRETIKEELIPEEEVEEQEGKIVRRKTFALKPMTEEDALLQMYLLGHSTFLFRNADDHDRVCMLYKGEDGDYGVIEEE